MGFFYKNFMTIGLKKPKWLAAKSHTAVTFNSTDKFKSLPITNEDQLCYSGYISVYLHLPKIDEYKINFIFNEGIHNLGQIMHDITLFFSQDHALYYSRFMGDQYFILKLYLPEKMIISYDEKLIISGDVIEKTSIHGCYCTWNNHKNYRVNPKFNICA